MIAGAQWQDIVHGAASLEPGDAGGMVPHRLPEWARAQMNDAMFGYVEACPGGVVLRFETDADAAVLTIGAVTIAGVGDGTPVVSPLIVRQDGNDTEVSSPVPAVIELGPGNEPVGFRPAAPQPVTLPTAGTGPVEVYLPHNARMELVSLDGSTEIRPVDAAGLRWTHYGSSISQGLNAISAVRTWPVAAARALGWKLHNLSFSGNAQLDGFAARLIRDTPADLITLKVGINLVNADSMRERAFLPAAHAFLDTIREGHPDTPIVLITALACPIHEAVPGPIVGGPDGTLHIARRDVELDTGALTLRRTREILTEVAQSRGDANLTLVDGLQLFSEDDAHLLYDKLHPDQEGLDLIASRFVELVGPIAAARMSATGSA